MAVSTESIVSPREAAIAELERRRNNDYVLQTLTDNKDRFKDADWFLYMLLNNKWLMQNGLCAVVGGAGGIGSWLSIMLKRIGLRFSIYDDDAIESHNLGGQLFSTNSVGKSKVEEVMSLTSVLCGHNYAPIGVVDRINESTGIGPIAFSCFDNMQARKAMFQSWVRNINDRPNSWIRAADSRYYGEFEPIFIDGRLLMEQLQIFCVRGFHPEDVERYESEFLFDDSEADDEVCTMKQTSHSAAMIASHMTGFFTNHLANMLTGDQAREVPFRWDYFIPANFVSE